MLLTEGHGMPSDCYQLGVLTFELLMGGPPFYNKNDRKKMFEDILSTEPQIPDHLSRECQDLLADLLNKNPTERLKMKEILSHPWLLPKSSPPFIPDPYQSYVDE
jgi:serine/threonine protein kinase